MKILFLSHKFSPDIGGIESHSEILANAFFAAGHDLHLLTWSKRIDNGKGFPFQVIRNPKKKRIIKEHLWADMIFENNPTMQLGWPNLLFNRPKIIALHTWISSPSGVIRLVDKLKIAYLSKSVNIISCSDAIRKKSYPKSIVIDNPYNNGLFKLMPDVKKQFDFVFLGRLVSDKGVDILINAFSLVYKNKTSLKKGLSLTIIGDGPEKNKLQNLAKSLDLTNNINFKGSLIGEELVTTLNQHKYIVVSSIWEEPFGMVALEGMACGCLPIVTDGGGLPDAVGNAGLVVPRGNTEALANTMQKILISEELEHKLRKNFTKHLAEHTPDIIANKYLEIIEKSVGL